MTGLGKRATELDMKQQEMDIQFDKQMKLARYNAGVAAARQREQIKANKEARDATMLTSGWIPNDSAPGGYTRDPELAKEILISKGKTSGGSGKSSTQYLNRTPDAQYDGKGHLIANTSSITSKDDVNPVNDILNASTEIQVLALKHAGVSLGDNVKTGSGKYQPKAVKKLVEEYIDVLDAFRFYYTGKEDKIKNFWGLGTSQPKLLNNDWNSMGLGIPTVEYEGGDGSNEY